MPYRNRDLLALARLAPTCMACGKRNEGDVVAAHANHVDKALGMKAPDYAWAALCTLRCHAELDQGKAMSREDRRAFWERAFWKTQAWLWESGHLIVNPETVLPQPPAPKVKAKIRGGGKIKSAGFPPADKRPKLQGGGRFASRRMGS